MANTGYKINPSVQQVFTTGPSSGSLVSSSYIINFDVSSSFTSALLCNTLYSYREFDSINCNITGYCITPTFINATAISCSSTPYFYNLTYNINGITSSIPSSQIEYSINPSFDFYVTQSRNNISDYSNSINIALTGSTPLNKNQPVYFRIKNNCVGSGSSLYSEILSAQCPLVPTTITNITSSTFIYCAQQSFNINGNSLESYRLNFSNINPGLAGYTIRVRDLISQTTLFSTPQPQFGSIPDLSFNLSTGGIRQLYVQLCSSNPPNPLAISNTSITIKVFKQSDNTIPYTFTLNATYS
jgi:hypothetical protein